MHSLKKILSVIATLATLANSMLVPATVLAQEITPSPTPDSTSLTPSPSAQPTDTASPTPDSTSLTPSPSAQPTVTPSATPTVAATPSAVVTPTPTDVTTPAPDSQTTQDESQTSNDNAQPQAPPEETTTPAPTITPVQPEKEGTLSTTVAQNVDLSQINLLNSNVDSPTVTTDKADYSPTDVVLITGTGFTPEKTYTIEIVSTDEPPVDFTDSVTADAQGSFVYSYQLDGTLRLNYSIYIKDGDTIAASTTFIDPPAPNPATTIDQCQNGGIGDPTQPCNESDYPAASGYGYEGNSNANSNNSHWTEGDFVPLRIVATNYASGSGNIQFSIDVTKGGKHAYDYVGNFYGTETTGASSATHANHNNPVTDIIASADPTTPDSIGNVPSAALSGFPVACGSDTFTGSQAAGTISAWGTKDPLTISYVTENVGSSDCTTTIQVAWSDTQPSFGGTIVIAYGAHIASQLDWGAGNSAISINGSPYHTSLVQYTTGGNTKGIGQQDAKLSASAVVPPSSITVVKDAQPDDPQDFAFTTTGAGLSNFALDDDSDPTLSNTQTFGGLYAGDYTVTEGVTTGWTLQSAVCVDNSNQQTVVTGNGATITLAAGQNVTCTFTNTRDKISPTVVTHIHDASHQTVTSVDAGTTVHDSVSVTGNYGTVTGDVTFDFFNNGICDGTPADTSNSFTLSGGSADATTFTQGPLDAGSYSFLAHYADDSNYLSADGVCEPLTVNRIGTTTTTEVHNGNHEDITDTHVNLGSVVHDSATVTPDTSGPTVGGTLTYKLFDNLTCDGNTLSTESGVSVGSESGDTSALGAGEYSYLVTYSGDTNYSRSEAACEPFTVDKAQLSVSTVVHDSSHGDVTNSSVDLGSVVHDTASVSGAVQGFSAPTPTFTLTSNYSGTCSNGSTVGNDGTDAGNSDYKSNDSSALAAGEYAYRAAVAGNDNYLGDTGSCEPFTVDKAQLGVSTTVHSDNPDQALSGNLTAGDGAHDSASVSGKVDSFTLPDVTFYFFDKGVSCTNGSTSGATTTLNAISPDTSGVAHPSTSETNLAAGDYNFMAAVDSNSNYTGSISDCEPFTVGNESPTIETTPTASPSPVLGATISDSATLDGGYYPTGTITFKLYHSLTENDCSGDPVVNPEDVQVSGNGTYYSSGYQVLLAGFWNWIASYSGDGNNNPVSGNCGDEQVEIPKADLGITTEIHNSSDESVVTNALPLGSTVHDSATVSGGVNGADLPDVTFYFFDKGVSCTNGDTKGATELNTVSPDGSGTAHPSLDESSLSAGTYNFMAVVAGDDNYNGATSDCEPFTVNKADLRISTNVHDASHTDITNGNVDLGSIVHDTASVSGAVDGFSLPDVSFKLTTNYTGESCAIGSPVATDGTENGYVKSADSSALAAGQYAYYATIASNSNYEGSGSVCEPFTVNKAEIDLSTEVHDAQHSDITNGSVVLGSAVHDTATVTGAVDGFNVPDPSFYLTSNFNGETCEEGNPIQNDGTDPGNSGYKSADDSSLSPGDYAYNAYISESDNYYSATSECEPFSIVANPGILIEKSNDKSGGASAGDVVTYTLKITNTGDVPLTGVDVQDILPGGFTYVTSSTTVNNIPFSDIGLSISGSTLSWSNVGNLNTGESLTLSYKANIASDLSNGTYTNFATCSATYFEEDTIDCNQDTSDVPLGGGPSYGGNLGGQVLGISTELPATGSPTLLLLAALGLLGVGIIIKKKYVKN